MINDGNSALSEQLYNEFVIADFGPFQIAIPSGVTSIPRKIFAVQVSLPRRHYSTRGILIWKYQSHFNLSGLTLKSLFPETSPFPTLRRLATGLPISFEIRSCQPLPQALAQLALLKCQIPGDGMPYHTVFKEVVPRFVKIVPNQGILQLNQQVRLCLQQETKLIQANWQQLKKTDFYYRTFSEPTQS